MYNKDCLQVVYVVSLIRPARPSVMSDAQKDVLKEFFRKPIISFNVVTDEEKKSVVWKYFGELAYRDPEGDSLQIVDTERHYCSKCIQDLQEIMPGQTFEKAVRNICFLSIGTATGNHRKHLQKRHQIIDLGDSNVHGSGGHAKRIKRTKKSKIQIISLDVIDASEAD